MRRALLISSLFSIALAAQAALPGNGAEGKKLHDANCVKCHDTSVYTRKDRHINSLDALNQQLNTCSHGAQVILSDDEQRNIVKYLNEQFYKFN